MTTTVTIKADHIAEGKRLSIAELGSNYEVVTMAEGATHEVTVHDMNSFSIQELDENIGSPPPTIGVKTNWLSFGDVVEGLRKGKRYAREGWNGKGMFVFLVNGSNFTVNREPLLSIMGEGTEVIYRPHIDMKTVDGEVVPWVASQSDVLADDWELVTKT